VATVAAHEGGLPLRRVAEWQCCAAAYTIGRAVPHDPPAATVRMCIRTTTPHSGALCVLGDTPLCRRTANLGRCWSFCRYYLPRAMAAVVGARIPRPPVPQSRRQPMPLFSGACLGSYEVQPAIEAGGRGEVYQARSSTKWCRASGRSSDKPLRVRQRSQPVHRMGPSPPHDLDGMATKSRPPSLAPKSSELRRAKPLAPSSERRRMRSQSSRHRLSTSAVSVAEHQLVA